MSSQSKKPKQCIFCDPKSIAKNARTDIHSRIHKAVDTGLRCFKCGGFSCDTCLNLIIKSIPMNSKLNEWFHQTTDYIETGTIPDEYIGNCCALEIDDTPNRNPPLSNRKFAGYLVCLDYGILISPSVSDMAVDLHAFGNDCQAKVDGVVHAVVSDDVAIQAAKNDVIPNSQKCRLVHEQIITTKIKDISNMTEQKEYKINVKFFSKTSNVSKFNSVLGHHATLEDLAQCSLNQEAVPSGCDIQFLLGESNQKGQYHLINARFVQQPGVIFGNKHMDASSLYNDCLKLTSRGYEYQRHNSGGPVLFDRTFLKFISISGVFPRKRRGVVMMKAKGDKNINAVYITTKGDTQTPVVHKRYTNPSIGGQFTVTKDVFNKHPVFLDMAACKIKTALLLEQLNTPLTFDFEMKVQPQAVKNTIFYFEKSCEYFETHDATNGDSKYAYSRIMFYFTNCFKFSLVAYPVAYHRDTFAKDTISPEQIFITNNNIKSYSDPAQHEVMANIPRASIENKCLFVIKSWVNRGVGRGGYSTSNGKACFVFALLDW